MMDTSCFNPTESLRKVLRILSFVILQICLVTMMAFPSLADDKNGVTPNTISLPSGPGSIEGLGGSFQPMLNTGTAKYAVKIAVPAGVAGHTPHLSLTYESGFGDGPAGIGWKFGPGSISRETDRGIPRYVDGPNELDDDQDGEIDEPDEVDRFIGLEGEELVELADGTHRARIEGIFIRYHRVKDETRDHWEAHLRDGNRVEFGITADGRVTDRTGTRVFRWLLEKSTDTNGNVIEYYYRSFWWADNQKYLKEIRYGPGGGPWRTFYFVSCTYEDGPDWRKDCRSGFAIKTAKRLKQIDMGIQGVFPSPDGLAIQLPLVDTKVHLADMDGNGISDLIQTPNSKGMYYYLKRGDSSWGERKRMSIQDTAPTAPFAFDDVKTADMDFGCIAVNNTFERRLLNAVTLALRPQRSIPQPW